MSTHQRPQHNKSQPPLLKNAAAAPFVYFDSVSAFGVVSGIVQLELAANVVVPKSDGDVQLEMVCTNHLRGSLAAMELLANAIDKALDMVRQAQPQPANGTMPREPKDYPDSPTKN
jgi:hypothetical protein